MIDTINGLFAAHGDLLDEDLLDDWLDLFTDDCLYLVVPRDNYTMGLPLATIRCESRASLKDRVVAVRETAVYAPRWQRHVIGAARPHADGTFTASYVVLQTLTDEVTQVFSAGRYIAKVDNGRFAELVVVYDSTLVPNSMVKPI